MGRRYHYTYRVRFPTQRWFYFGLHSTEDLNDGYCGSPYTHREKWENFAWEFKILEFHDSRETAASVELRLIKPFLHDPHCLNENAGRCFSFEAASRGGKKGGRVKRITEKHVTRDSEKQRQKALNFWRDDDGTHRERVRSLGLRNKEDGTLARATAAAIKARSRQIEVTCPDGRVLTFPSGAEAGRQLGIFGSALLEVARGERPHHHRHTARFT